MIATKQKSNHRGSTLISINNKITQYEQQRIHHHIQNSDVLSFFNLLTGPDMLDTVETLLPKHRERAFPPTKMSSMF